MLKKIKEIYNNKDNLKRSLKWLAEISAPHKGALFALLLANLVVTSIGVATAAINKYIVDLASSSMSVTLYAVVAVLFALISLFTSVFMGLFSVRITEKYSYHIRSKMYEHILNSVWSERRAVHSEDFLSKMTSDAAVVSNGVVKVTIEIFSTVFQIIAAFFLLLYYDTSMAIVAIVSGPLAAVASLLLGSKLKSIQTKIQQSEADYRKFLQEHISNADIINVFGQEKQSLKQLNELQTKRFYWIKMKNRYTVYAGATISAIFSATYLFAFITGAVKIGSGAITFGTMTAFLSLISQVQSPILSLSNLLPSGIGVLACSGRIMQISDMELEKKPRLKSRKSSSPLGVKASNITLSYSETNVVSSLSFDVKPGQTAMVAGESGIGKTTLLRALLGFLPTQEGTLCMYNDDGETLRCSATTRKLISYVPQGNTLLSGTIEENLKIANPKATYEQMVSALKAACVWDYINELPHGIKTEIGEKAVGLSEGQAQRIAIARAFLKPFDLLILDEATSALDEQTEKEILQNLKTVLNGKTCIFVSHRKSVESYADTIINI